MHIGNKHIIKRICLMMFFPLLIACQSENASYIIEGSMPSTKYDGEWIYLAPAQGKSQGRIDSTQVINGRFRFTGSGEAMRIIRTRILLRLKFQELLVVTEPGIIQARIDSIGSVIGTPQNDALQTWKNRKEETGRQWQQLNQALKQSIGKDSVVIRQQMDSLNLAFQQFHYEFLLKHVPGTLGNFFYSMTRSTLTAEQQHELDERAKTK